VPQTRKEIFAWVGSHVLPHEGDVRKWLRRFVLDSADIDDVIQESYCRIAALESVAHIENGILLAERTGLEPATPGVTGRTPVPERGSNIAVLPCFHNAGIVTCDVNIPGFKISDQQTTPTLYRGPAQAHARRCPARTSAGGEDYLSSQYRVTTS
jgi:hypothetical protein